MLNDTMCNKIHLRKRILEIHQDDTLCSREKSRRTQQLMSYSSPRLTSSQQQPKEYERTYHDKDKTILGCTHYARNVKVHADCCKQVFPCRHCHDIESDHALNRSEIKTMLCMSCMSLQPAGQYCKSCDTRAARYYCSTCHFWNDNISQPSYHCDGCGLCRQGREEDFYHCPKCRACIPKAIEKTHPCVERSLESDCPVCTEYLATSTSPVIIMKCGHAIHKSCYRAYLHTGAYQCPLCKRSIREMKRWFGQLKDILLTTTRPYISTVYCNDCQQRSDTLYHKCQHCSSFNTIILDRPK